MPSTTGLASNGYSSTSHPSIEHGYKVGERWASNTSYFVSRHSGISAAISVHPYPPHPDTSTVETKLNA